jgi:hypothetical protein
MIGVTMPPWLQQVLVALLVAGCLAVVLWWAVRAVRGKSSVLGRCCAKGCPPQSAATKPEGGAQRKVFLSAEALASRARNKR